MQIKRIDHLVIPVENIENSIRFYTEILGMDLDSSNDRFALVFGKQKINLHVGKKQFLPAAKRPAFGSMDLCFMIEGDIDSVKKELESKNITIEEGIVRRHGATGIIDSIYIRDPDGNLIELSAPA